ncbi:hypothetical protein [Alkalicoccus chagannorensis]|uniref:hypothetical protein n=1 Tax=Alkalicoccus chagannorensis TaxID=427072 RepID=UPI0004265BC6|nr:hypothetical protein [Alkalicoccus chagannorensis]
MGYIPQIRDEQAMNYANRQELQKRRELTVDPITSIDLYGSLERRSPYENLFMRYERIAQAKLRKQLQEQDGTILKQSGYGVQKEKKQPDDALRREEAKVSRKGSYFDEMA